MWRIFRRLKQAFREGLDIHAMTASEMFDVPLEKMTPDIRRQAKAINFGVIYGISGFGLARNLRIPRADAQGFIDRYFERFPGIRAYMDATVGFAKEHGFVQTLFGRKIHTPEINSKGPTAGFRQTRRDQRADPGGGGGYPAARDDPDAEGDRGAGCQDAADGA